MLRIRASSLPLIAACPASAIEPAVKVVRSGPEARMGTAVHAVLAEWIRSGVDHEAIGRAAAAQGFDDGGDIEEITSLCWSAWGMWTRELGQWFPDPQVEDEWGPLIVGDVVLTGHTDVWDVVSLTPDDPTPEEFRLIDWKTSRIEPDYASQVKGYCLLGMEEMHVDKSRACVVYVRAGVAVWYTWTRDELRAWFAEVAAKAGSEIYSPDSSTCRYCQRIWECSYGTQLMRSSANVMTELEGLPTDMDMPADVRGSFLANLNAAAKLIEDRAAEVRDWIKAAVAASPDQSIPMVDGRQLTLKQTERRSIDNVPVARQILSETLTPEAIVRTLKMSKTAVEKEVMAAAPYRQKGKMKDAVIEALDTANCLKTTYSESLVVVPAVQKLEDKS